MDLKEIQAILEANTEGGTLSLCSAGDAVSEPGGLSFGETHKLAGSFARLAVHYLEENAAATEIAVSRA